MVIIYPVITKKPRPAAGFFFAKNLLPANASLRKHKKCNTRSHMEVRPMSNSMAAIAALLNKKTAQQDFDSTGENNLIHNVDNPVDKSVDNPVDNLQKVDKRHNKKEFRNRGNRKLTKKDEIIHVRMRQEQLEKLRAVAENHEMSVSHYVRSLISKSMKGKGKIL
jgi:predicted DNA binding CopG/RHH family protein